MEISRRKIKSRTRRKTNVELVETINLSRKSPVWTKMGVTRYLSMSTRNMPRVNISKIEENSKDGEVVVVPGKVLSSGIIKKKIKVCAFSFSKQAMENLQSSGCKVSKIIDEIKSNPKALGVRMII